MSLNIFELLLRTIAITFHDHKKVRLDFLKDKFKICFKGREKHSWKLTLLCNQCCWRNPPDKNNNAGTLISNRKGLPVTSRTAKVREILPSECIWKDNSPVMVASYCTFWRLFLYYINYKNKNYKLIISFI